MLRVPRPRRPGQEPARPQPVPSSTPPPLYGVPTEFTPEERARWDASQEHLPPNQRRTLEQACIDDEERMAAGYRRGAEEGLL